MTKIEDTRTDNLITLISKLGGQTKFANAIERTPQQVNQWLKHSPSSKTGKPLYISTGSCRMIERALSLPEGWMDQPAQKITTVHEIELDPVKQLGIETRDVPAKTVPIYDHPKWNNIEEKGDAIGWIVCPVPCGKRTYALKVRDNSMQNPNGQNSFTTGDIVYIDPDESPINEDFVFATSSRYKMASIKQFIIQEEKEFLYTSNPSWQRQWIEIDDTIKLHGVIIATMRNIR